jgi:DNA-binding NarL/FixJ family response regulator
MGGTRDQPLGDLTGAEKRVLRVLREHRDWNNEQIAAELNLSKGTVEQHLKNAARKMVIAGRINVLERAIADGQI